MGFLRRLFGRRKQPASTGGSASNPGKDKKTRKKDKSHLVPSSLDHFDPSTSSAPFTESLDANKHAIAVAAATAAVAEAALAAAHAAAEVVRLTSGSGGAGNSSRPATPANVRTGQQRWMEEVAAVKMQSAFRGYLARKALRALRALVKLQALVRGHIVRRQTADMLRRMQTLVRLQARARANRVDLPDHLCSRKPSLYHHPVPEGYKHSLRASNMFIDESSILKRCSSNANFRDFNSERKQFGPNWLDRWMEESVSNQQHRDASLKNGHNDDEKYCDKILEVDTWKPHFNSQCSSSSSSFHTAQHYWASDYNNDNFLAYDSPSRRSTKALNQTGFSSREMSSMSSFKFQKRKEEAASRTVENSPQSFSAPSRPGSSARKGPFTPTRSESSWGFFGGYSGHPNYMASTESFQAKIRSQSAPRQRLEFERYGSNRKPVRGLWDTLHNPERDADFRSTVYAHSSHLNRIGGNTLR